MGCGALKCSLLLFNAVFCLGGVALVVVGSLVQWNVDHYETILESIPLPGVILIVIGCATFIVAFIGSVGVIKELYWLILIFAICLLVTFVLQIAVGVVTIVYQPTLKMSLEETMSRAMLEYPESGQHGLSARRAWDRIQTKFRCCGISDPWEWIHVPGMSSFPDSCKCAQSDERCVGDVFAFGCLEDLAAWLGLLLSILAGVSITFSLVGAIFAISLASSVRRRMHTV